MKKNYLLFITFITLAARADNIAWLNSFEQAQKLAMVTNKPILIDFWAIWCRPCSQMDKDTWSKEDVQTILTDNYIPLKIDIDTYKELARKYSINSIPTVLIVDPLGEVITSYKGYKDKQKMVKILKQNTVDLTILQQDFVNYYNNKNGDFAIEIAKKYFDLSLFVNRDTKHDYLKLANKYLKNAQKAYKKSGNKNKNEQLIDLLSGPYDYICKGKFEKALKNIQKNFDEDNILSESQLIYTFINYVCYQKLENREQEKVWYNKLKTFDDFKILILKARKM